MKAVNTKPPDTITVHVPMKFASRGGRKMVVAPVPDNAPRRKIDNASIKALARAHRWRQRIENSKYASITELAQAEGVNQSYACRMLRLTLLAPSVVEAILDGLQNSDVMLKHLMKPLPIRWDEQLVALRLGGHSQLQSISSRPIDKMTDVRSVRVWTPDA